ncbi:MAG: sterol desaturase family protein, partial [Rickettsiales bacterium]|nr:sterol desaturase family protein [Rickettsiales bacterium]
GALMPQYYILGFGTEGIVLASGIRVAWNYFVHCNIHLVFPSFLHYIIASPHVHRWHHATDKEAINKNFTIMFCCIDYVFGTFYAPRDRFPKSLGLHDEATIPFKNNIFSHLIYPFKRHYYWIQKKKSKMKQKIEKESKA